MTCRIEIDGYDQASFYKRIIRKAKKQHRCCECNAIINKKEEYEYYKALFDNEWSSYKTCLACVECRDAFMDGWYFEGVWEDIREGCGDEITIEDIEGLSKRARDKLMERMNL